MTTILEYITENRKAEYLRKAKLAEEFGVDVMANGYKELQNNPLKLVTKKGLKEFGDLEVKTAVWKPGRGGSQYCEFTTTDNRIIRFCFGEWRRWFLYEVK